MADETDRFIPTRSSLLTRLKNADDHEGWLDFFNTYWRLIYGVALKAGLNEAEAEEVVQETVISVARNIPEYRYDPKVCSFKTWLLQTTRWRILDQWRRRRRESQWRAQPAASEAGPSSLEDISDPAASRVDEIWEEEWRQHLLALALERVKQQVRPLQYQIFDLLVFQEWPVAEVRKKLRLSAAQVYTTRYRLAGLLRKEIRKQEAKME